MVTKLFSLLSLFILIVFGVTAQDSLSTIPKLTIITGQKGPIKYYLGTTQISYDSFKMTLLSSSKSKVEITKAIKFRYVVNKLSTPLAILCIPTVALGVASKLNGFNKSWYNTTFISLSIPTAGLMFYIIHASGKSKRHFIRAIDLYNIPWHSSPTENYRQHAVCC